MHLIVPEPRTEQLNKLKYIEWIVDPHNFVRVCKICFNIFILKMRKLSYR